jgi:hypothetical protein
MVMMTGKLSSTYIKVAWHWDISLHGLEQSVKSAVTWAVMQTEAFQCGMEKAVGDLFEETAEEVWKVSQEF